MNNNSVPRKRAGIALFIIILLIGVFFTVREIQNQQQLRGKASTDNLQPSQSPNAACSDTAASQSTCTWDPLPNATEYNITIVDTATKNIIKSGTIQAPLTKFDFPSTPGNTYECNVNAINACGAGSTAKSQPTACIAPPSPTLAPSPPVCREDESKCTWDSLPEASSYNVKIINTDTEETIKSGTVSSPETEFTFTTQPDISYKCEVTAINKCGEGTPKESPPVVCKNNPTPTPITPTEETTPSPSPTDTPTPAPSLQPSPTNTPAPTPTSTPTPPQAPTPTYTSVPTQPPVIIVQNNPTPPPQTIYRQNTSLAQQPVYQTPIPQKIYPTIAATGTVGTSAIIAGISIVLITIGGAIFLIL